MCVPALAQVGALFTGGGAATAAGATAAATTGITLQGLGTALSIGGALAQGIHSRNVANANVEMIEEQRAAEKKQNAQKDLRARRQFQSQIRKQMAELSERGVTIDSPSAVLLGQEAASEMSFQSQSIRQEGHARDGQLSTEAFGYRAKAASSFLNGFVSASGTLLTQAPRLWPKLGAEG